MLRGGAPIMYSIITPVRDELENLRRLAPCLVGQTQTPEQWVIVDNGSSDGTRDFVDALRLEHVG